jgi:preprotein translocase subunit SecG
MPWDYISMTLLAGLGLLMMVVILLQRGRGGGLAGAFGGMGGQSAFGTKAGDVFTRITIVIATLWVVLAGLSGFALRAGSNLYEGGSEVTPAQKEIVAPDQKAPADNKPQDKQNGAPGGAAEKPKAGAGAAGEKAEPKDGPVLPDNKPAGDNKPEPPKAP